jgi:hypothetical protein
MYHRGPPAHGPPQTSSSSTPRLPGHIRAQSLREVHTCLPPSGHNVLGFGALLQQPPSGPVMEREDTATPCALEAYHGVSWQGQAGLHPQWDWLQEQQLQPVSWHKLAVAPPAMPPQPATGTTCSGHHVHFPSCFNIWATISARGWCGSLPQWSECSPIGAYHGSSNAHWVVHRLVRTSDKHIKIRSSGTAASVMVMLMSRQYISKCTLPAIADIHQASRCSRCFVGHTAIASLASLCYNSIAWLPMQRRLASSQSVGRQFEESWAARSHLAAEAILLRAEFHWILSDTSCVRNTFLIKAHNTSLVTAHTALEIWPFLGPQHLTSYLILCLPACLPAHLYTWLTDIDICYSVTWLPLWTSASHWSNNGLCSREF